MGFMFKEIQTSGPALVASWLSMVCATSAARLIQLLGIDLQHPPVSSHAVTAAHIQKEEDWQQMIAQGKPFSAKTKQNNYNEKFPHTDQDGYYKKNKQKITSVGKDVEQLYTCLHTVCGNVKGCSCCGKEYSSSSKR